MTRLAATAGLAAARATSRTHERHDAPNACLGSRGTQKTRRLSMLPRYGINNKLTEPPATGPPVRGNIRMTREPGLPLFWKRRGWVALLTKGKASGMKGGGARKTLKSRANEHGRARHEYEIHRASPLFFLLRSTFFTSSIDASEGIRRARANNDA